MKKSLNAVHPRRHMALHPGWILAMALVGAPALAAKGSAQSATEAQYRLDRAVCLEKAVGDERTTCLREAGAVRAEALAARPDGDAEAYRRNALQRCKQLPASDQSACIARMQGQGKVRGSVQAGGIYRELVIREAGPAASAAQR